MNDSHIPELERRCWLAPTDTTLSEALRRVMVTSKQEMWDCICENGYVHIVLTREGAQKFIDETIIRPKDQLKILPTTEWIKFDGFHITFDDEGAPSSKYFKIQGRRPTK